VEPLLRIDRGSLRLASARNVAYGTAGNASAGASAGSVLSGNSSPLAMPPATATDYKGAAQPLNMAIVLRTPSCLVSLTSAEFVAQQHAYADLVRRLNAGHSYGVEQYIETFGLINSRTTRMEMDGAKTFGAEWESCSSDIFICTGWSAGVCMGGSFCLGPSHKRKPVGQHLRTNRGLTNTTQHSSVSSQIPSLTTWHACTFCLSIAGPGGSTIRG
jgi:hypothetical protein